MGIKVKAIERNIAFDKSKEAHYAYVMQPELYGQLGQEKVIEQAALNAGMPKPAMRAAVNAYGEVVKTWATEGHSIPIPGLGTMRFGVRSKSVDNVADVKATLITSRHVIFTPSTDIKKELAETPVSITCYDRNGKVVKTVTSEDNNDVEATDEDKTDTSGSEDKTSGATDAGGTTTGDGGTTAGGGESSGGEY